MTDSTRGEALQQRDAPRIEDREVYYLVSELPNVAAVLEPEGVRSPSSRLEYESDDGTVKAQR